MSVLRVLWMSTHGCFAIPFSPHPFDDTSVDGVQEQEIPEAYYYVETADDQE